MESDPRIPRFFERDPATGEITRINVDRITNGLTSPFFGWLSDQIGREIAFTLEGTAMTAWLLTRSNPVVFVIMSGVVLFGCGEIFSLFPLTLTDTYGTRHATTNYGFLYMAQGVGSVFGGPVAALVHDAFGSWMPVFAIIIAMNFATALLAGVALMPMRRRWLKKERGLKPAFLATVSEEEESCR